MRKLNFLKAIIDYVYIMSVISFPLAIIVSVLFMFNSEMLNFPISRGVSEYVGIWDKIAILIILAGFGLSVYALYHFKILLANFKEKLIFEIGTCLLFHTIGKTIIYFALVLFVFGLIPKTKQTTNISVTFGLSPTLLIVALGLFFMVLAEVFKMGKQLKEENELTI